MNSTLILLHGLNKSVHTAAGPRYLIPRYILQQFLELVEEKPEIAKNILRVALSSRGQDRRCTTGVTVTD